MKEKHSIPDRNPIRMNKIPKLVIENLWHSKPYIAGTRESTHDSEACRDVMIGWKEMTNGKGSEEDAKIKGKSWVKQGWTQLLMDGCCCNTSATHCVNPSWSWRTFSVFHRHQQMKKIVQVQDDAKDEEEVGRGSTEEDEDRNRAEETVSVWIRHFNKSRSCINSLSSSVSAIW